MRRNILLELPNIKFHENLFRGVLVVASGQTEGNLTGEFMQLFVANATKKEAKEVYLFSSTCSLYCLAFYGRSPTEATRLFFDQEKSRLLVKPSVRNGASPTSATTMR
jgi:hypothetical protein